MSTTATSAPDLSFDDDKYEITPTTWSYHERQHGQVMAIGVHGVKYKNPDIDLLVQAVLAMQEQLLDNEAKCDSLSGD